jgi:predicted RNA-binding protein YlxR (DUF448 family)
MSDTDGAPGKGRSRRCAATGDCLPDDQLIRFAVSPDGVIAPDIAAKLPGRGVWVRADRASIDTAARRGGFARSLKRAVEAPSDLSATTERLLARRCLDFIGLAQRAGGLAVGGLQVESAIRQAPPHWLIEASDGASDGRKKLARLHFGLWGCEPNLAGCFESAELGVALGREPVVHLAVLDESMARRLSLDIGRLAGFRALTPPSWR